jgi:hypothetical protein
MQLLLFSSESSAHNKNAMIPATAPINAPSAFIPAAALEVAPGDPDDVPVLDEPGVVLVADDTSDERLEAMLEALEPTTDERDDRSEDAPDAMEDRTEESPLCL